MAVKVQIVIDCADPAKLAAFWVEALGYHIPGPPQGFASWPEFLTSIGVPESDFNMASAVEDPDGVGPRIFLQRVPEPKADKNRVHIDLNVGGGHQVPIDERRNRLAEEVARLEKLGAGKVGEKDERGEFWIVMRDPEGNEFCVQ
jgi:catechol 2,3-dioxygenase-like lactoylglutathione lyase family enzyme